MADEVATPTMQSGTWNTRQALMATLEMASQAAGAVEDCADRATVFARIAGLLYRAGDEFPWTTRTSYHRARGTFLRRRAGTYSRRR